MSTFEVSIITPDDYKTRSIRSISGDAQNGRFVVLKGYEASIFALKNGVISLVLEDNAKERLFVEGAVLKIQDESYILTAERILDIAAVNKEFLENYPDREVVARVMRQMEA